MIHLRTPIILFDAAKRKRYNRKNGGMPMKDRGFYAKLFFSTFYLSAFTFGGGYVIVPLMRKKFVE